jgi:hypothetical protein
MAVGREVDVHSGEGAHDGYVVQAVMGGTKGTVADTAAHTDNFNTVPVNKPHQP